MRYQLNNNKKKYGIRWGWGTQKWEKWLKWISGWNYIYKERKKKSIIWTLSLESVYYERNKSRYYGWGKNNNEDELSFMKKDPIIAIF